MAFGALGDDRELLLRQGRQLGGVRLGGGQRCQALLEPAELLACLVVLALVPVPVGRRRRQLVRELLVGAVGEFLGERVQVLVRCGGVDPFGRPRPAFHGGDDEAPPGGRGREALDQPGGARPWARA